MLKYLVILLDDTSTSFCHYENGEKKNMMTTVVLEKGILFAMKYDLKIQYVLPQYDLPQEYNKLIETMYHDNIGSIEQSDKSDIVVINGISELVKIQNNSLNTNKRYLLRTTIMDFCGELKSLKPLFESNISVNVVFTDVESFSDKMIGQYEKSLDELGGTVFSLLKNGHNFNTNLLTDRIALDEMNNCGAGETTITLAPNGKFYPCPAFYYDKSEYYEIGDVDKGLNIRDKKLYTLQCSPLCQHCDAFQCKKCVWLNKKLTYEINVPSRQQCLLAHIERNASKKMLDEFHKMNVLKEKTIDAIDYLDPFDKYKTT